MNATEARLAMRKLWGKRACCRLDEQAPKAQERDHIRAGLGELQRAADAAKAAAAARRAELLADPEYLRLRDIAELAAKAHANALNQSHRYRVTIGYTNGIGMTVRGEGDNWQEAIDRATFLAEATGGAA